MSNAFTLKLEARAKAIDSLLCVGLDADISGAARSMYQIYRLIHVTAKYAAAFKINAAHFLAGTMSFEDLEAVVSYIPKDIPVILDWKCCGDIKETAEAWATLIFDEMKVDAVTLSPYMGVGNLEPWFRRKKGVFLLCRTSNSEGDFIQQMTWKWVLEEGESYGANFVFGACRLQEMKEARQKYGSQAWFLVPGVGAQGQPLGEAVKSGLRYDGLGLLINVSRGISQAADPELAAKEYRDLIRGFREQNTRRDT